MPLRLHTKPVASTIMVLVALHAAATAAAVVPAHPDPAHHSVDFAAVLAELAEPLLPHELALAM